MNEEFGLGMLLCSFLYHVLVNVLVHVTRPFPDIHFARTHPQLSHDMGREVLIRKEIDSGARECIPHVSYDCRSISGGADVVAFSFLIRLRVDVGNHLAGCVSRSPFFNFLHFNRVRQRTAGPCRGEDFAAGQENRCGLCHERDGAKDDRLVLSFLRFECQAVRVTNVAASGSGKLLQLGILVVVYEKQNPFLGEQFECLVSHTSDSFAVVGCVPSRINVGRIYPKEVRKSRTSEIRHCSPFTGREVSVYRTQTDHTDFCRLVKEPERDGSRRRGRVLARMAVRRYAHSHQLIPLSLLLRFTSSNRPPGRSTLRNSGSISGSISGAALHFCCHSAPLVLWESSRPWRRRDEEIQKFSGRELFLLRAAVLSPVERQNRALAPIAKGRMCPSRGATVDRGCALAGRAVRGLLQPGSPAQRDWICDTAG